MLITFPLIFLADDGTHGRALSPPVLDYGVMVGGSTATLQLRLANRGHAPLPLCLSITAKVSKCYIHACSVSYRIFVMGVTSMGTQNSGEGKLIQSVLWSPSFWRGKILVGGGKFQVPPPSV